MTTIASHRVLITLASNHDAANQLSAARRRLAAWLTEAVYTEEIWTEAEGSHASGKYLNQMVSGMTTLDAETLQQHLKEAERQAERNDECRRQGIVPIDLDLMMHDDQRYHLRDWQRSYTVKLLKLLNDLTTKPT